MKWTLIYYQTLNSAIWISTYDIREIIYKYSFLVILALVEKFLHKENEIELKVNDTNKMTLQNKITITSPFFCVKITSIDS